VLGAEKPLLEAAMVKKPNNIADRYPDPGKFGRLMSRMAGGEEMSKSGRAVFWVTAALLLGVPQPARAQEELAAAYAAYQAAEKIYNGYKKVIEILEVPGPTPEDQILAQLAIVQGSINVLDEKLRNLDQNLATLVWQQKREIYLERLQEAQKSEAMAQTANQQLAQWIQTKRNVGTLNDAENNSHLAANQLRQESLYLRPGPQENSPDIFDPRPALVPYMYALTVRLGVVAVSQPNFRQLKSFTDEFKSHAIWLEQILPRLEEEILCQHDKYYDQSGRAYFYISSRCTDKLSGFESAIIKSKYFHNAGTNPYITPWIVGSQADGDNALAYYSFYDRWWVQERIGKHTVQKLLAYVKGVASPTPRFGGGAVLGLANLEAGYLGNGGGCLTASWISFLGGLNLSRCGSSPVQQNWTTRLGTPAVVMIGGGDGCIEVDQWDTSSAFANAYVEKCSGSPGEQWTLTADRQLRWGYDPSQCLTNANGWVRLERCSGTHTQRWYNTIVIPRSFRGLGR
jgi:hypothetical protein